MKPWLVILIHQLISQGMFVTKNIVLHNKTGKQILGNNKEASTSVTLFTLFIGVSLVLSIFNLSFGKIELFDSYYAMILATILLLLNIIISGISLLHLKNSWRVGVLEDQKTELITLGIYRFTRNPYFVSYLLMFAAYTILLQNLIILGLSLLCFIFVHKMIKKEEEYLLCEHGDAYLQYKTKTPRYLIL